MPQLPDPTGISRRIPSGQRAIASADGSGIGRAMQGMGETISNIGEQQADKRDRYELAVAKTQWLKARTEAEQQLEDDKDYGTYVSKYTDNVTKRMDEINGSISNSRVREMFQQEQLQDMEMGTARVRSKAWSVEVDHHKGLLVDDLADLRQTALTSGQTTEAINIMQERINAAAEMGYLNDTEAATMRQKSAIDYAVSRIEMAPASEREDLLKTQLGKIVPADKAEQIRKVAKDERIKNEAILTADLWLAQGLSLEDGMKEAEKIKDPDVRRATEERFKLQYQVEQKAKQDASNNLFQNKVDLIEQGEWSYDDITPQERATLTATQQNSLQTLYQNKVTGRKVETDIRVYDHMEMLLANEKYPEARQYYVDNVAKFSDKDQRRYSELTNKALSDSTEVKSLMTQKEYLKNAAKDAGVGDSDVRTLQRRLDTWYQEYQIANGEVPSDVDVQKAIDQLVLRRPDTGFFSDDYFFEAESSSTELLLKNEPQKHVNMVAEQFKAQMGREPTPDELMFHYFNNKRKGKFDGD